MPRPCLSYPDPHITPRIDGPQPCPLCTADTPGHPRFSIAHHLEWNGALTAPSPDCFHLGTALSVQSSTCGGCTEKIRACDLHGRCRTAAAAKDRVRSCAQCHDYAIAQPIKITRIDSNGLAGRQHKFNPSIIDYHGRRLMAYRDTRGGSDIYIASLNEGSPTQGMRQTTHIASTLSSWS